jgi:hypothetical protein
VAREGAALTAGVEVIDVDRYHREVGRIFLGERFVNMEMVRDGFAWRNVTYDKPGEFTAAEAPRASPRLMGRSEPGAALGMASRKAACPEPDKARGCDTPRLEVVRSGKWVIFRRSRKRVEITGEHQM